MSVEKIVDRVKKMLALGNCAGTTEAERETALRMAYNLLAKHNLSMADLPTEQAEARDRMDVTISADKWARSVAASVSKLFFCKYFFCRTGVSGKDMHCFVGKESNVVTARYMAEHLIASIKKEASRRYHSPTSPEGRSFCVGTMNSIYKRVEAMITQDTESTPGTALVLANLHTSEAVENDKWLATVGVKVKDSKSRADNSLRANAFYDGKKYGNTVSLNKQVGGTSGHQLLK